MVRKTRNKVKIGKRTSKRFWTGKGMRKRCPLSQLLFNCMVTDIEDYMRKERWREG